MAACADLSTHGQRTIIRLATELSASALAALQQIAPQLFTEVTEIGWQDSGQFIAQRHQQLGQIRLRSQRLPELNAEQWQAAWQHFIRQRGLDCLPWSTEALNLRARIAIDYTLQPPILAVKLQEMFGYEDQPSVLNGQLPLLIHLLSPARRPLLVTADLPHFWRNTYADVRKEMRGRYPKHPWPEDPLSAEATRLTKAALQRRNGPV